MTWNPTAASAISSLFSLTSLGGSITVPAGGSYTSPAIQAGGLYSCYDLALNAYTESQTTAGAPLTLSCVLQWYLDSGLTQPVGPPDSWQFWTGNAANSAFNCYVSGQVRGNYFTITFNSSAGATTPQVVTVLNIFGSNRFQSGTVYSQDPPGIGDISATIPLLSSVTSYTPNLTSDLDLYDFNPDGPAVPANGSYWQPMPLYAGPVYSYMLFAEAWDKAPTLCVANHILNNEVSPGGDGSNNILVFYGNTSGEPIMGSFTSGTTAPFGTGGMINFPAIPTFLTVETTSTAVNFGYHLVGQRYS